MAIDPRISLTPSPTINVGQRFGQALQNVQSLDSLQQNRRLAPLKEQQAQMNVDMLSQQQAQANNPLNQALLNAEQEAKLDQFNAKALNTALATNNPQVVTEALNQQLKRAIEYNLPNDIAEAKQALQLVNQEGGLRVIQQATTAALTPTGSQIKSVGQKERQQALAVLESDPKQDTLAGKEAAIFLGLTPKASISASERIAKDENKTVSQLIADQTRTEENIKTKASGKRKALSTAVNFAETANQTMIQIPSVLRNYKDAIEQIDQGANTGVVYNMLPSFDINALILDTIGKSAGLDLAKSQGGIMTDADLKFGIDVAIPQDLPPTELKAFLQKKIRVQNEIYNNLLETVKFLGDGEKTLADWYKQKGIQSKTVKMSDDELLKGM